MRPEEWVAHLIKGTFLETVEVLTLRNLKLPATARLGTGVGAAGLVWRDARRSHQPSTTAEEDYVARMA